MSVNESEEGEKQGKIAFLGNFEKVRVRYKVRGFVETLTVPF